MSSKVKSNFDLWMAKVDQAVARKSGLSVYDLADQCYRDMYDDGFTPSQAAQVALSEEGFED